MQLVNLPAEHHSKLDDMSRELTCEKWQNSALVLPAPRLAAKRLLDLSAALLLLIPGIPMMLVLCLLVRLASPGPAIFRQVRVGRRGRLFVMYKMRSMRIDAEQRTGPIWTAGNDPRVTTIGRWLRRLHLDELPQLFNVLRGDMSLVGPRPERPEFVRVLAAEIPGYLDRLTVAPGITGLAQINLPPDTDLNSVRRKQVLDLEYIQTAGVWLDCRILASTLLRLVGVRGGAGVKLLGLRRRVHLPGSAQQGQALLTPTAIEGKATSGGVDQPEKRPQLEPSASDLGK